MPHRGGDWWKDNEARAEEQRRESERVAAHYQKQGQLHEERENAAN